MKYLQLIFMSLLMIACSGTKSVIENTPQKTAEIKKIVKDTIIQKTVIVEQEPTIIVDEEITDDPTKESITKDVFNHSDWNHLLKKYVSENGNVNYKDFKTDRIKLSNYIKKLGDNVPNEETWTKNDKLAYWINAYNALTVDLILRHYPIESIKDIDKPWEQRLWKLGEKWYNLEEIEHQILRKMDEPRIHFAIVCASFSCPKLQNEAFTSSKIENQLTNATKEFLSDSKRNSIFVDSLELSKIFQWFSKDFKRNGSVIDFINQYTDFKISENAKIKYKDYNWALNE